MLYEIFFISILHGLRTMADGKTFTPITDWGRWLHDLAQLSDNELGNRDVAEINLRVRSGPARDGQFASRRLPREGR